MLRQEHIEKLQQIKLLLLDIDGILTDGRAMWIEGTGWTSNYSIKDGLGMKLLQEAGIPIGLISGRSAKSMQERAKDLKIQHVHLGIENKLTAFEEIKKKLGCSDKEIAYMGDDLIDLPVLKKVGFAATVPTAAAEVKAIVHYITQEAAGFGAVREVCDLILYHSQFAKRESD
jgi:3-deoxy-D-manno-octulosonate 8-phosphate phosphatase (KDO 8-P phosphatase)